MLLRFFFFFRGVGVSAAPHSLQDLRSGTRVELGSQKWKCRVLTIGQPGDSCCFVQKKKTDIWTCYKGNFLRDNGQIKRWEKLYLSLRTAITTLPEYWVQKVTFLNSDKVFDFLVLCHLLGRTFPQVRAINKHKQKVSKEEGKHERFNWGLLIRNRNELASKFFLLEYLNKYWEEISNSRAKFSF